MKVIVLCGGLGTRLGELTRHTPKPLLEVGGRPFIAHVLDQLAQAPVTGFILALGFQGQKLIDAIGHDWRGLPVEHALEETALGTGGAVLRAFRRWQLDAAVVANGDTLLGVAPADLLAVSQRHDADVAMALKQMPDSSRFGRVRLDPDGRVTAFDEKASAGPGLVNAGLYHVRASAFRADLPPAFSFERDLLARRLAQLRVFGLPTEAYFIDMGIPTDLARARLELAAGQDTPRDPWTAGPGQAEVRDLQGAGTHTPEQP